MRYADAQIAYAQYLNAPRHVLSDEQRVLFEEDVKRARAAAERAWLEEKLEIP